ETISTNQKLALSHKVQAKPLAVGSGADSLLPPVRSGAGGRVGSWFCSQFCSQRHNFLDDPQLAVPSPLLSPSLFSVRGPRQRAQGRREGLQAISRQRSARASSYGVLPRSDPQGRDTYTTWTLKQPFRLHLGS